MRNLLAHEYFKVDMVEIWGTVQESLPILKVQVSKILKQLSPEDNHLSV